MCHANEHDVRVRFQPVLFVLRRLTGAMPLKPASQMREVGFFIG
jgi:hypothetical protein